ncbi:MAG: glycogen synthase GlgA [Myxococcales bacterium]|nr:glycogen synthase GlgA [Myxococcota bacterium]MDW8282799.1 glycogen synthase GlgA [Myxococcales bacterium]
MNILHVASEVAPLSKTGGLGDVVGGLPRALAGRPGIHPMVVSPRYGSIDPAEHGLARRLRRVPVPLGDQVFEVEVFEGRLPRSQVPVYLVEHPLFSERTGLYGPGDPPGQDYPDNPLRFALLCRAALGIVQEFGIYPDVVHGHDWQGALAVYYAKRAPLEPPGAHRPAPACVFTIHNLSFLGLCPLSEAPQLSLRPEDTGPDGLEFYGQLSLLKAGLVFSDRLTTVSPRYAREIQTPEFGCGMEGLLGALSGKLVGILNGADYDRWNPATDPYLPQNYGGVEALSTPEGMSRVLAGKARCKAELQRELSLLPRPRAPLCATISRLTDQKGIDLLLAVLEGEEIWQGEMQYVILGSGERAYEERLRVLARRHPGRLAVRIGYDEPLAHRVEAGADLYIMPSRFEPCGLNQIYSLRYGTIPVVRAVGGLDDSVVDFDARSRSGTGFKFHAYEPAALLHAWRRALLAYEGDAEAWQALIRRAMRTDLSWEASSAAYLRVYQQALAAAQPAK